MRNYFQKSAPAGLGALMILSLTIATAPAQRIGANRTSDAAPQAAAAKVVNEIMGTPDEAIPRDLFNKAAAIVLPYIRSEWGNSSPPLAQEGFAVLQKELTGGTDSWNHVDWGAVTADAILLGYEAGAAKPGARAVVKVSMRNIKFYPQTLKIKKGDVVEWKNDDLVPHTATSTSFDSGSMNPGTSWRHTFTKAGQFAYVCTFHPTMTGVIVVK